MSHLWVASVGKGSQFMSSQDVRMSLLKCCSLQLMYNVILPNKYKIRGKCYNVNLVTKLLEG